MKKSRNKLVMTLLVRDEGDIIERNICFHLNHGVDHIVAMDNNSVDKTTKILKKYEKHGVLTYFNQSDNTYEQSKWVSHMAKYAVEKLGATHLIHSDADEFWLAESGDLKDYLPHTNEVYYVNSLSYLPQTLLEKISGLHCVVVNPIPYHAQVDRELSYRYLLYQSQPKIITNSNFTQIAQGNHDVLTNKPIKRTELKGITIHHFPVRSYRQFKNKVINGGKSYMNNPNKDYTIGWQWNEWYIMYNSGILPLVYLSMFLTLTERLILIYRKIIRYQRVSNSLSSLS